MKKQVLAAVAVLLAVSAQAQDEATTSSAATVPAARAANRMMTTQALEMRLQRYEEDYREAGIPEDKIKQLSTLERQTYEAIASGQKVDLKGLMTKRREILSPEEQAKFEEYRKQKRQKLLDRAPDAASTRTRSSLTTATKSI